MLVEIYRHYNFNWPILLGNRLKRSPVSAVSIAAFDLNLHVYGIKNREKWSSRPAMWTLKSEHWRGFFFSFKSLGLLHEQFNFLYQDLTFHRGFPHTWIRIPKGHHQLDPFCRRRVASAFEFLFLHLYLLGNLVLTAAERFRRYYFTKPHFPHHQSEAVHVHLGVVDFLFGAYLWSHVQWCATICSCDLVFNGGQPQVCHFDLLVFGYL